MVKERAKIVEMRELKRSHEHFPASSPIHPTRQQKLIHKIFNKWSSIPISHVFILFSFFFWRILIAKIHHLTAFYLFYIFKCKSFIIIYYYFFLNFHRIQSSNLFWKALFELISSSAIAKAPWERTTTKSLASPRAPQRTTSKRPTVKWHSNTIRTRTRSPVRRTNSRYLNKI